MNIRHTRISWKLLLGSIILVALVYGIWHVSTHVAVMNLKGRRYRYMPELIASASSVYDAQQQAKYHPDSRLEPIMFEAPISKDASLKADRLCRKGVLKIQPGAQAAVVMAHGFMCTKDDVSFLRTLFSPYHVIAFDFRAHGEHKSDQCCSFGCHETQELIAAVNFMKNHPETKGVPVIVYGFSMGAVTALLAQAQHPDLAQALILDCPFESTDMVVHRLVEQLSLDIYGTKIDLPGRCFIKKYIYEPRMQSILKAALKTVAHTGTNDTLTCIEPVCPLMYAHQITVPTLFIACKGDDKSPVSAVRALYDQVCAYKRLWITHGRCHFDSFFYQPEKYMYKIQKFIQDILSGVFIHKVSEKIVYDGGPEGEYDV
jgi:pimeloyl-ACP methyl ester carboxylesterase